MKKSILFVALSLAVSLANAAELQQNKGQQQPRAKFVRVVMPVYSQKVAFKMPASWKPAFQDEKQDITVAEFMPGNENKSTWTRMFSVQGFKGLASKVNSETFLNKLETNFKTSCGDRLVYEPLGAIMVDSYKAFGAILGCGKMPGTNWAEVGFYLAIQGEKDIYLAHKSFRSEPFEPKKSPLTKATVASFMSDIMPIELCKPGGRRGECQK